jgi:hypothetical protein
MNQYYCDYTSNNQCQCIDNTECQCHNNIQYQCNTTGCSVPRYTTNSTKVNIKLGLPKPGDAAKKWPQLGTGDDQLKITGISILSINMRGYGNINYGSTVTGGGLSSGVEHDITSSGGWNYPKLDEVNQYPDWTRQRGNGAILLTTETGPTKYAVGDKDRDGNQPQICDNFSVVVPCGISSFEVVVMVWGHERELKSTKWDPPYNSITDPVSSLTFWPESSMTVASFAGQVWVAVWHVDLANCKVTAVSWTRVFSENINESCSTSSPDDDRFVNVAGTKYMNSSFSRACYSSTETTTKCDSDLSDIGVDSGLTDTLTLFTKSSSNGC